MKNHINLWDNIAQFDFKISIRENETKTEYFSLIDAIQTQWKQKRTLNNWTKQQTKEANIKLKHFEDD